MGLGWSGHWPKRKRTLALRVAEGDHLSEQSERGKLPQHKTRALAALRKLKTLLGGASGGMQGGPRRGRSPITGPTLPHAAQASQAPPEGETQCPQGRRIQSPPPGRRNARRIGGTARRAGVPTSPEGETPCPQGRRNQSPLAGGRTARRAGIPNVGQA